MAWRARASSCAASGEAVGGLSGAAMTALRIGPTLSEAERRHLNHVIAVFEARGFTTAAAAARKLLAREGSPLPSASWQAANRNTPMRRGLHIPK